MSTLINQDKFSKYPVAVDYGLTIEQAIGLGRYDWVNESVARNNFPTERKGKAELIVELIYFGYKVSSNKALKELDLMGYRPAELHELLALNEKYYPEIQKEYPIVALGSIWEDWYGWRRVPALHQDASEDNPDLPRLGLPSIRSEWETRWRFAAVRK